MLICYVINPILTGWEGNTGKYKPKDSNISPTEGRACITVRGLIFSVLPDRTVNIEVINRL